MKPCILSLLAVGVLLNGSHAGAQPPQAAKPPGLNGAPGVAPAAPQPKTDFSKIFKSEEEKNNYAVGMSWASQIRMRLRGADFQLDTEAMTRGFRDTLNDTNIITDAQMKEILTDLNMQLRAKAEQKRKEEMEKRRILGEKNKAEGEAFLAKNKTEPGIMTLASGLQYKVLKEGDGAVPKPNDEVTVNYAGTLLDGKEFDSSKPGKPFTTSVRGGPGGVINGWVEALELMKTGSKWKLFIPPNLAYGETGSAAIPPNSTLIFEVELLSVKAGPQAPPPPPVPSGAPLTSDIIRVPSAEGLKKGEKIETIKAEDLAKEQAKEAAKGGSQPPK